MITLQTKRGMWIANDKYVWHLNFLSGECWYLTHEEFYELADACRKT